jgi:hypothetical protein
MFASFYEFSIGLWIYSVNTACLTESSKYQLYSIGFNEARTLTVTQLMLFCIAKLVYEIIAGFNSNWPVKQILQYLLAACYNI